MAPTPSGATPRITGAILCGGEGRRMGGADKPLLCHAGEPLVAHVARRLAPQVSGYGIIANRSLAAYAALGVPVHPDRTPGLGPLGGLATALEVAATRGGASADGATSDGAMADGAMALLFACPGDAPFLAPDLVARLHAALGPHDDAAYPHDGTRSQPLFLLLRTTTRPALAAFLEAGGRAVHAFLSTVRARVVDTTDLAGSFRNINTPEELRALARDDG